MDVAQVPAKIVQHALVSRKVKGTDTLLDVTVCQGPGPVTGASIEHRNALIRNG